MADRTNIVLLPKISNPKNLVDFRPISLWLVVYKILVKVLANHHQRVTEKCIDGAESAFFLGRLISHNVILVYELLNTFRQKHYGKKRFMVVKLDTSKAYDRVE